MLDKRDLNVGALAQRTGLPRARLRRVLSGGEPMIVDELLTISQALELDPTELGLSVPALEEPTEGPGALALAGSESAEVVETKVSVDPWGNHPRQLFEVAFGLGCDFFFFSEVAELVDSGVPQSVLSKYEGGRLPLKLDAAFHEYNNPRYSETLLTIDLSFDAIYTCRFPWSAIKQVVFYPPPPSETMGGEDDSPEDEQPRSHLRLVT
jgi:hypothetical protein